MTKQFSWADTCRKKSSYSSRRDAMVALASMQRSRKIEGQLPKPYSCPHCQQWHLGRSLSPKQRRAKQRAFDQLKRKTEDTMQEEFTSAPVPLPVATPTHELPILIEPDGNMWRANRADFLDAQASRCEYGRDPIAAILALLDREIADGAVPRPATSTYEPNHEVNVARELVRFADRWRHWVDVHLGCDLFTVAALIEKVEPHLSTTQIEPGRWDVRLTRHDGLREPIAIAVEAVVAREHDTPSDAIRAGAVLVGHRLYDLIR